MSEASAGRPGGASRRPALAVAPLCVTLLSVVFFSVVLWVAVPAAASDGGGAGGPEDSGSAAALLEHTLGVCRSATAADLSPGVRARLSDAIAAAQLRLDAGVEVVKTLERLQLECEGALVTAQPSSEEEPGAALSTASSAVADRRSPDNRTAARAALAACETALGRQADPAAQALIEAAPAGPAASAAAFEALRALCAASSTEAESAGSSCARAVMSSRLPRLGHFLCAGERARTAYEIVAVRVTGRGPLGWYRLRLDCVRWPKREIPEHATVHPWRWDGRGRRARRSG